MKKTYLVLIILLYLCLAKEVRGEEQDLLLSIMRNSWSNNNIWAESQEQPEDCSEKYNEVTEVYSVDYENDYENGEHYSWDNLYLNPYDNTEVIVDPYGDTNY